MRALALLLLGLALAHSELLSAEPVPNARLEAPPKEVRLRFGEPFEVGLSRFEVYALGRVDLPKANGLAALLLSKGSKAPRVDLGARVQGLEVRLPLKPLAPGAYAVVYRVLAKDGHPTRGVYVFLVGP